MQEEREIKKQLQRKAINNLFSNDYVYMPQQSKLLDKKCLEIALDERDELEKFTRLVIMKGVETSIVSGSKCCSAYNNTMIGLYSTDTWCLTEDEFNFAKKMIEKYGEK